MASSNLPSNRFQGGTKMKLFVTKIIWTALFFFFVICALKICSSDRHDTVLVAFLDGTLSLVEIESRKFHWSIKTGLPIYSSFQASANVDIDTDNSELEDDSYIDCGDDWNLYKHHRAKGTVTVERSKGPKTKTLFLETQKVHKNKVVMGEVTDTLFFVDVKTGIVLRKARLSDFSKLGFEEEKEEESFATKGYKDNEVFFITRHDYSFVAFSILSGKVIWKLSVAEFKAESSSTRRTHVYRAKMKFRSSNQTMC